jgi:hypothetical protein
VGRAAADPQEVPAERGRRVLAAPRAGQEPEQQRQAQQVQELQHGRVAPGDAHGGRDGGERVDERSRTRSGSKMGLLPGDHRHEHGRHRGGIQTPWQLAQRQVGQCANQHANGQQS